MLQSARMYWREKITPQEARETLNLTLQTALSFVSKIIYALSAFFLPMTLFAVDTGGFAVYFSFIYVLDFYVLNHYFSRVFHKMWRLPVTRLWCIGAGLLAYAFLHAAVTSGVSQAVVMLGKMGIFVYGFFYYRYKMTAARHWLAPFLAGLAVTIGYGLYQQVSFVFFDFSLPLSDPLQFPFTFRQGHNVSAINDLLSLIFGKWIIVAANKLRIATTASLNPEPSYFATVLLPLLFLFKSPLAKVAMLAALCMTLSKSAITVVLYLMFIYVLKKSGVKNVYVYILIPIAVSLAVASYVVTYFGAGSTFYARFFSFHAFVSELPLWERITGIGYLQHGAYFPVDYGSDRAVNNFGGILVDLGIFGLVLYVMFFGELMKKAKEDYVIIAIMMMLFNYFYFTTWPIFAFYTAWAMGTERDKG